MAVGPWVPIAERYETQARCNRIAGHTLPHRLYDGRSFAVLREWIGIFEPDERVRRRIGEE
jgi:hypothetical protein